MRVNFVDRSEIKVKLSELNTGDGFVKPREYDSECNTYKEAYMYIGYGATTNWHEYMTLNNDPVISRAEDMDVIPVNIKITVEI